VNTTEQVQDFIIQELRWGGPREQLTPDYPLLENSVIDSLGLMQIVQFLEVECGVEIADEELVPENFATLSAIAKLVESKTQ
jgi:acyl carrier protein